TEQLTKIGQKRRLPNAPGHQADMIQTGQVREAVAERSPGFERVAGTERGEQSRELAHDQVDDVHGGGLFLSVENRVVKREGPAQERIGGAGQTEHQELSRAHCPRQRGCMEPKLIRVARQSIVEGYRDVAVEESTHACCDSSRLLRSVVRRRAS